MFTLEQKKKLLIFEASRWVGVREIGGDNKGQLVEMFQKEVDGKAQGEPWCMAYIQFCIRSAERLIKYVTGENCESLLPKTEHCMTLFNKAPAHLKLSSPEIGCLVIWQFYKDGKPTASGHVGLVTDILADGTLITNEGNTSDGLGVVREGDGVYVRRRSPKGSASMRIAGFVKVW